jgi:deoxyribodipyrimidine photolyase
MKSQNRILFWFRENLNLKGNLALYKALDECSELIPVYCFDPREIAISNELENQKLFINQLITKVSLLRNNLQKNGTNLLVVNDYFEKVIPSLARILQVDSVISDLPVQENYSSFDKVSGFRYQKVIEVKNLLNMHSIPVNLSVFQPADACMPSIFPTFPEINPGIIPTPDQFLNQIDDNFRSVAC